MFLNPLVNRVQVKDGWMNVLLTQTQDCRQKTGCPTIAQINNDGWCWWLGWLWVLVVLTRRERSGVSPAESTAAQN